MLSVLLSCHTAKVANFSQGVSPIWYFFLLPSLRIYTPCLRVKVNRVGELAGILLCRVGFSTSTGH